ncbi:MAG: 5-formyltetrahydrofolate cyclo-ligase [Gammaproteobacteria bacterium]|nr:5-formyltetrahydrofolate cyclo-ligase [Gammaproteobacteria bacterium]
MADRTQLRAEMRSRRRSLAPALRQAAEQRIAQRLAGLNTLRQSRRIACYLANDGEIDLSQTIARLWARHRRCYLPVLDHLNGNSLWFAPYTPDTPLVVNCYGIPEPDVATRHYLRARSLELILAPLVAFDTQGNRLGMGGGYYDRTLQFLQRRHCWLRPRLLGIAYDFQRLPALPRQPWDVPLHGIITDQCYYPVPRDGGQR